MRIVNVCGGLGNQMFQYAFALALKERFPGEDILLDTQHYRHLFFGRIGSYNLHNGFEIPELFPGASLKIATRQQIRTVSRYIPNYILSRIARKYLPALPSEFIEKANYSYDPEPLRIPGDCYYEGYWQCEEFYRTLVPELRSVFSFKDPNDYNRTIEAKVLLEDSVGIHIRRGDYLKDPEYKGICEVDYYRRAVDLLGTEGKMFFVFSNDIPWCMECLPLFIPEENILYVTGNMGKNSPWDMYLMSRCKQLIIANSTFSWWGAYLNETAQRIVAPRKWINRNGRIDICPKSWILI